MDMTGEYRIPAPRDRVWAALNDPDVLQASIPGCQSLERTAENEFAAKVVAKVGPVKAAFNGHVVLQNINVPESYTISGEGKGGAAGFAKGGADVHLKDDGEETVLTYTAKADVGGKLAQLGSRLIQGTAKKMADEFFENFRRQLTPAAAPPPVEQQDAAAAAVVEEGRPAAIVEEPSPGRQAEKPRPTPPLEQQDAAAAAVVEEGRPAAIVEEPSPARPTGAAQERPATVAAQEPPRETAAQERRPETAPPPARETQPVGNTLADLAHNRFVWAAGAIIVLMLIIMLFR